MSGTIGAFSNNAFGVAGINWVSHVQPLRVLGKCGGYTSDIADAIRWAAGLPVAGVPANATPDDVVNLSLGGDGACGSTFQSAIDAAVAAGTVVVVAAGNSNANASGFSPGNCNDVITVAATGHTGSRAYYSNYGASVEIAAPGGDALLGKTILSTLNSGTTTPVASPQGDTYASYQGTSMATPHVVGVVSLMLSVNPSLTPAQVTSMLQATATPFPAGSTCTGSTCGAGIVNAAAAVAQANGGGGPHTTWRVRKDRSSQPGVRSRNVDNAAVGLELGRRKLRVLRRHDRRLELLHRLGRHRGRDVGDAVEPQPGHDVLLAGAGDECRGRHLRGRRRLVDVLDPGLADAARRVLEALAVERPEEPVETRRADLGCEHGRHLVRVVRLHDERILRGVDFHVGNLGLGRRPRRADAVLLAGAGAERQRYDRRQRRHVVELPHPLTQGPILRA